MTEFILRPLDHASMKVVHTLNKYSFMFWSLHYFMACRAMSCDAYFSWYHIVGSLWWEARTVWLWILTKKTWKNQNNYKCKAERQLRWRIIGYRYGDDFKWKMTTAAAIGAIKDVMTTFYCNFYFFFVYSFFFLL